MAISETAWDGSGSSVVVAVKEGERGGALVLFGLNGVVNWGQGNQRAGSGGERSGHVRQGSGERVLPL